MKNIKLSLAIILISGIAITSCKKRDTKKEEERDTEQATVSDNNTAENISSDVDVMGSQVSENGNVTTFRSSSTDLLIAASCATVTSAFNGTAITTATVDFGSSCVGKDGRTRSGKLFYDFTGSTSNAKFYRNPGFKMVVTSQNYLVDGNSVSITKTVTNTTPVSIGTGTNPGTNLTWQITGNVTIVKANNEGTITRSCNRTKTLLNTNDANVYKGQFLAIDWTKAIIQLNGTANGTNAKGENFSVTATNLVRDFNCAPDPLRPHRHPFISGTLQYTPGNRPTRYVDFGNGACDFGAIVTIEGQQFSISLN
ncbi:MAG: hypothetical protein LCH32_06175 [Bacteroidetes bacterium]|nr:hypothetical protein [Bacteroidota bacterium]